MTRFTIEAKHDDDIFDLKVKELHVKFREIGVDVFPKEYVEYPNNLIINDIPNFHTSLVNTWLKRNRSEEALEILYNAYEKAKNQSKVA